MKRSLSLTTALLCASLLLSTAKAAETEPNNSRAQANTLALNGSNTGKINPAADQDWWVVTTTGDGKLDITLTPLNKYTWVYLYDNDGVTQLNAHYSTAAFTMGTDGLAAGTYYLKVVCFYATDTVSYTISNTLTEPAQANDVEPNGNRAQAKVLPLNGSRTGHVGYYYNNLRDTADWFRVTTTSDGRLDLNLTVANGKYTWIYLYDNNGTTVLNSSYTTTTLTQSTDGLAAGTYYVRVICFYYNSDFAPYTLSNTLTPPAQATDTEPNGSRATALTLAPNATTTGHVGYFYNNNRDTADWYKITTTQDGQFKLSLNVANGKYVWVYLYDNDGTTVLNSSYTTTSLNQLTDGLAAGTYYIKINCYYYNSDFAPYTFTDSLLTYTNANDAAAESNAKPYLAKTLSANTATPGHVGFYYNNQRDSADWWKINYTGTGAMTVDLNIEPTKQYGYQYTWMEIYKDTNATAIYASYVFGSILTANLTSLTQGYYWVRVRTYYNTQFESYTLTPTFTQTNTASITLLNATPVNSCDSLNTIRLQCNGSSAPYRVQLYRFGVLYSSMNVNNTNPFNITNLPTGYYTARAYGDGASGTAYGTGAAAQLEPTPSGLTTTNIQSTQARVSWTGYSGCVLGYRLQYRVVGATTWTIRYLYNTTTNITALTPATNYEWRVASGDSANTLIAFSANSVIANFTTAAAFAASSIGAADESSITAVNADALKIYPNPASTQFTVQLNTIKATGNISLWLKNMNGSVVWNKINIAATSAKGTVVDVSRIPAGIYMLHITDQSNNTVAVKKVVVSK